MADGYISQIKTPDNKVYDLKDNDKISSIISSGTAPLTLSGSKNGTTYTLTGSVADASISASGIVNTSAQSFAGIKTFYDHYTNGHIASITTTAGQYAVIRCTNKGAWMTSFHVRIYTSYESYTLEISGYNYGNNNWYSPKAIMVASTSTSKVTVTFGYDNDATNNYKTLWVAIPIGNYPGIDVQSVVTGYSDTQPRFSVTIESSIPATVQTTVDAYRPWYRNETVSNATTATNLSAKPSLAASGNNITVTAGGKTSDVFTVPYATNAGTATSLTHFVISTHTIPGGKGVRIKYPSYAPVLISCQRSNVGGRLILIGGGYGERGTICNDFTELVSPAESNFTWSMPEPTGYACTIEIMNVQTSGDATVWVETTGSCTFTEISALTSTKTNRILLNSSNYTNYAVAKTAGVTAVTWDATNKKLTRTINGTAADVMTAAQMSAALELGTIASKAEDSYMKFGGDDTGLGGGSPAATAKTYWADTTKVSDNMITGYYNHSGAEYSLLFSKHSTYGSILKWGYSDRYLRILRVQGGTWKSTDWEKVDAGYADSADYATQLSFKNRRIASADLDISTMHSRMLLTLASSSMTTNKPPMGDGYIVTYGWDNAYWGAQQAISHTKTPHMTIRGTNGGSTNDWGNWIYLLDANNYTDYTVTKTGTGASGTWGISVTGTAANVTGTVAIEHGGTGATTASAAANALISGLPTWTATPTADTYFIRRDTTGAAAFGQVKFSSIANITNNTLTLGPYSSTLVTSVNGNIGAVTITAADLGLSNAMHFIGVVASSSTNTPSDGSNSVPTITGLSSYTPAAGDVIIDKDNLREYVWSNGAWILLGFTTSNIYNSDSITASSSDEPTWISNIQQATDGKISVQRQTIGTLGIGHGGTGKSEWTQWGIVYASATNTLDQVTAGASNNINQPLISGGAAAPKWYAGLTLTGNGTQESPYDVTFSNTVTITGATTLSSTLSVADNSTLTGKVGIGASPDNNYQLYVNGNSQFNGNLIPTITNNNADKTLGSSDNRWAKLYIGNDDNHGDAYTPVYWNDGVPTEVTLVQQCAFTIKSGKSGVKLSHAAITANSYVTEIVITSGESKLNSAISWTSAAGYIELTCSSTVSGDVTGYIMISRGGEITATATDIT